MARWSPRGFHLQHWHELLALTFIDLYDGQPERALERIRSQWQPLRRSMLMRLQITAGQARYLRATASLAVAARVGPSGDPHVEAALRDAEALETIGARWTIAHAALVRGSAASLRGDAGEAERALAAAMEGFEALELKLFAAVARRRLGEVRGGAEGAALAHAADAWMTAEGVVRPDAIARMIAPSKA
jgi:hypothetical protein